MKVKKTPIIKITPWTGIEREGIIEEGEIEEIDMYAYELALSAGVCRACLIKIRKYIERAN